MRGIILNVVGLLAAIAIFSGTFAFTASGMQQVQEQPTVADTGKEFDDDQLQNDIGIGDLLPDLSSQISSESQQISSEEASSEASSESSSSTPSSQAPSSKPSSTPSKTSSNTPPPSSSAPSSAPPPSSSTPSDNLDNELLMIISGAVQREIVGTNTTPSPVYYEAYKAQAIACLSYMEYHRLRTGVYPSMAYSNPHSKTIELVASVLHLKLYSNGQVINAVYHAASGGHTQSASFVWGGTLSYAHAVQSNYDDYNSNFTISISDAQNRLNSYGIAVSGDASTWFDLAGATLTDGGFINTINICGTVVTGRVLRENIFGSANLKSCKITDISVVGNNFVFSTKGYGHGVGMSQLGALGYAANQGFTYAQILQHYYANITIR